MFRGVLDLQSTEDDFPLFECIHTVRSSHDPTFADQGASTEVGIVNDDTSLV